MEWFRYLKQGQLVPLYDENDELIENTNYSYPYVRRRLPRIVSKDGISIDTWLSVDISDLNIANFYDGGVEKTIDPSSYLVVYTSEELGPDFQPTKCIIHENTLYFQSADNHAVNEESYGEYYLYYHTPNIRYVQGLINGPEYDDSKFEYKVVSPVIAPYLVDYSEIDDLTYEVNLNSKSGYNFSFANSESDWKSGETSYPGAKAYISFSGPFVSVFGSKGPDFGKVRLNITGLGNEATPLAQVEKSDIIIDCYSSEYQENVLLFSQTDEDLSYRDYVIEFSVTADRNPLSKGNKFKLNSYRFNYNLYMKFEDEELSDQMIFASSGMIRGLSSLNRI